MIPAGYMAKRIAQRPEWLRAAPVESVYSVSGCVSRNFADYVPFWKHNGYWLFNSVGSIQSLASEQSIDLTGCMFFFYEIFGLEFDDEAERWRSFRPDESFATSVILPNKMQLEGYDVVTFSCRTSPECSPLSCNSLAETIPVNCHCLLESLDEAELRIETGAFRNSEPGPYRIFGAHSVLA